LGLMPICSVYTIVTVIGPLNRLFHLGQWRLLRITGQPENDILQAKEAIAQIRVWLVIAVEVGLRIIIVTVFLLNNFYAFYQISLSRDYFLLTAILNPLCWGFYLLVSVIGVVFAVEPIFRMRVIVALGIATAMQVRQTTIAFLTGFALVLPVQIIQVALIGGLMAGYQTLAHAGEEVDVMMVFALTGLSVLVELVGYVVYVGLRKATLWFIYRRALGLD
ncbi:MAG TPA: hypothetical protein VHO69_06560, partial [Phototrophicaceae bacterium]|nr:hypothetical protein [Phototrophicaceae bacterium]